MTERNHPNENQALALIDSERFCEFLDATDALPSGWPHNRTTARWWLIDQCGIETLGRLATDPAGAAALHQVVRRFDAWERNGELAV